MGNTIRNMNIGGADGICDIKDCGQPAFVMFEFGDDPKVHRFCLTHQELVNTFEGISLTDNKRSGTPLPLSTPNPTKTSRC